MHKNFEEEIVYFIKEDNDNISISVSDLAGSQLYSFVKAPGKRLVDGNLNNIFLGKGKELKNKKVHLGTVMSGYEAEKPVYKMRVSLFRNGIKDFEKLYEYSTDFLHSLVMYRIILNFDFKK